MDQSCFAFSCQDFSLFFVETDVRVQAEAQQGNNLWKKKQRNYKEQNAIALLSITLQ